MTHSAAIAELATALAKAQSEMEGAAKDTANPFFKSKYADLQSVWTACRKALTKNGLAVAQVAGGDGVTVTVTTLLTHSSGQWLRGELTMTPTKNDPQGIGSCITYARRYALASMVGVAPEDDDGNAASQPSVSKPVAVAAKPDGFDKFADALTDVVPEGTDRLKKAWAAARPEYRQYMTKYHNEQWETLKAKAAQNEQVPA